MKKKLLLGIAALSLTCFCVQAGYLRIDGEEDVERVSNNVQSFLYRHHDDLKEFLSKQSKESLTNILHSDDEVVNDIKQNRRNYLMAIEDIGQSIEWLKENGPKKFMGTIKGLMIINKIIASS
jgi:hypothetical protein